MDRVRPGPPRVNPATDEQRRVSALGSTDLGVTASADVAFGGGFVWIGTSDGRLVRFDPATGRERIVTGLDPIDAIAFGYRSIWATDSVGGALSRYDSVTMRRVAEIDLPTGADSLASGDAAIWALSMSLGTLTRVDPTTNDATGVVQVGANPSGLAAGSGAIWVGDEDGVIRRVDEDTRSVTEIPFGAEIRALAFDDQTDTLWVDVA